MVCGIITCKVIHVTSTSTLRLPIQILGFGTSTTELGEVSSIVLNSFKVATSHTSSLKHSSSYISRMPRARLYTPTLPLQDNVERLFQISVSRYSQADSPFMLSIYEAKINSSAKRAPGVGSSATTTYCYTKGRTVISGRLNVIKSLKRRNRIVRTRES
jgi:hypothetical protein